MQLHADDIDEAIEELKRALPVTALQNIVANRQAHHRPSAELSRVLRLKKAQQIVGELLRD